MTKSEWVTNNLDEIRRWVGNIINQKSNIPLLDDFVQDIILIFLEHKKSDELVNNGGAKPFILQIALNQIRSNTSKLHKTYRPPFSFDLDNFDISDDMDINWREDIEIETILLSLDQLYEGTEKERYYSILIMFYFSLDENLSELSRRLNLPRTTIRKHFVTGLNLLKNKVKVNISNIDTIDQIKLNNTSEKIIKSKILNNLK